MTLPTQLEMFNMALLKEEKEFSLDKNIAKNIKDFFTVFGEDADLMKNILFYISKQYSENDFNFGKLDPYEFAELFNYKPGYLRRKHKNPAQLQNMSPKEIDNLYEREKLNPEDKVWDSILENALFLLARHNLPLSYGGKIYSQSTTDASKYFYSGIKSIRFFSDISVVLAYNEKRRGNRKVFYHINVDDSFINNLGSYYLGIVRGSLLQLRGKKSHDLYVYLKNLREDMKVSKKHIYHVPFSLLCELAKALNASPSKNKMKITAQLEEIKTKSELDFEFRWIKGENDRYPYTIEIKDINNMAYLSKDDNEKVVKLEKEKVFSTRVIHDLLHQLYRKQYQEQFNIKDPIIRRTYFWKWLLNNEIDRTAKENLFKISHLSIYNREAHQYRYGEYSITEFVESYQKELLAGKVKPLEDVSTKILSTEHWNEVVKKLEEFVTKKDFENVFEKIQFSHFDIEKNTFTIKVFKRSDIDLIENKYINNVREILIKVMGNPRINLEYSLIEKEKKK